MNFFYNTNNKTIEILNENDYNTRRLYLKMIDIYHNCIYVKITKINKSDNIYFNKIKVITDLLNNHDNFIKVDYIFIYNYKFLYYNYIYNFIKDYDNYLYICEIRNYYKFDCLTNYIKKFSLTDLKLLLDQIIFAQLSVFFLYGFTHNNISLNNIFYEDTEREIRYRYHDGAHTIKTNKIYKLTNYDYSILYNDIYTINYELDYLNSKYFNYDHTLFYNIHKTICCCINLLNDDDRKYFRSVLNDDDIINDFNRFEHRTGKDLVSYFRGEYNFNDLMEKCYHSIFYYLNKIWLKIYNTKFK